MSLQHERRLKLLRLSHEDRCNKDEHLLHIQWLDMSKKQKREQLVELCKSGDSDAAEYFIKNCLEGVHKKTVWTKFTRDGLVAAVKHNYEDTAIMLSKYVHFEWSMLLAAQYSMNRLFDHVFAKIDRSDQSVPATLINILIESIKHDNEHMCRALFTSGLCYGKKSGHKLVERLFWSSVDDYAPVSIMILLGGFIDHAFPFSTMIESGGFDLTKFVNYKLHRSRYADMYVLSSKLTDTALAKLSLITIPDDCAIHTWKPAVEQFKKDLLGRLDMLNRLLYNDLTGAVCRFLTGVTLHEYRNM